MGLVRKHAKSTRYTAHGRSIRYRGFSHLSYAEEPQWRRAWGGGIRDARMISTGHVRRWLRRALPGRAQDDGRLEHSWQLHLWRAIQAGSGSIVRHDAMLGSGRVGARQREAINMSFGNGVGSGAMSPGSAAWAAARCLLVFVLTVSRDRQLRGHEPLALGTPTRAKN